LDRHPGLQHGWSFRPRPGLRRWRDPLFSLPPLLLLPFHSSLLPFHSSLLPFHSSLLPFHSSLLPSPFSLLPSPFSLLPSLLLSFSPGASPFFTFYSLLLPFHSSLLPPPFLLRPGRKSIFHFLFSTSPFSLLLFSCCPSRLAPSHRPAADTCVRLQHGTAYATLRLPSSAPASAHIPSSSI
jgi:hypothetical protein